MKVIQPNKNHSHSNSSNQLIIFQIMILKQNVSINLKQPVKKISCFSAAYSNTYVFTRVDLPGSAESIVHIDQHGDILHEYKYTTLIGQFAMLYDKEVIVLNLSKKQIDIINLERNTVTSIDHKFLLDDVHQMEILTFYKTKYFCVVEIDRTKEKLFKLTYYSYGALTSPIESYCSNKFAWSNDHNLVKLNEHSKIGWFSKKNHQKYILIEIYHISSQLKGVHTKLSIQNPLIMFNKSTFDVHDIWENTDQVYTLLTSSKIIAFDNDQEEFISQNCSANYIFDAVTNVMRKASYSLRNNTVEWSNQIPDWFQLGQFSVFHTRFSSGGLPVTSTFYVNNEREQVISSEMGHPKIKVKYYRPGYESRQYFQMTYENSKVSHIKLTRIKIATLKEILLHFMLHLNQDFDDDLLQDALELIEAE